VPEPSSAASHRPILVAFVLALAAVPPDTY